MDSRYLASGTWNSVFNFSGIPGSKNLDSGFHKQKSSGFRNPNSLRLGDCYLQFYSRLFAHLDYHIPPTYDMALGFKSFAKCLLIVFVNYVVFFYFSFLIDHEGMSALDDKMSHLKQDMTLYRRQHDNKRGDDEV